MLIVASALAFVVAGVYLSVPVRNPGVQDCGAPGAHLVTNRQDRVIEVGTPDALPDAVQLRTQPSCRDRVAVSLERAALFVAAGVGIGLIGAVLGLIDDRMRLRRAPRFEDLLRPRPADAPVPMLDPRPVRADDIGGRLPPPDGTEATTVLLGGLAGVVGLVIMAGIEPLRAVAGEVSLLHVAGLAAVVALSRLAAGLTRWLALGPWSSGEDGSELDPVQGSHEGLDPEDLAEVALAADGQARLAPGLGVAGLDLHHLVHRGLPREEAARRVAGASSVSVVVHVVLLVASLLAAGTAATEPEGRTYPVALGVLALVTALGAARVRRHWRAAAVLPSVQGLVGASAPQRRVRSASAAAGAVVQILLEVASLWLAVTAVGGSSKLSVLAAAWLVAVTVGMLAPVGSGAGLTEGVLGVVLWRSGLTAAEAALAVLLLRLATWWLPIVPGLLTARRLRSEGRI